MLEKFEAVAGRIAMQRHLQALRDGIILGMPLIIIGSFFLIAGNLPFAGYTEWLADIGIAPYLAKIVNGSFGIMALAAAFGIANSLAHYYSVDGTSAGILSVASFIIVSPDLISEIGTGVDYVVLGSSGLFVAIIVGLSTTEIFRFFVQNNWTITMPDGVPPAVSKSFEALIPGFMVITFWGFMFGLLQTLGVENIHDLIANTLGRPLSAVGSTLWGSLIMIGLNSLFWFMGLHGANVVNPIITPVWLQNTDANRLAFEAGEALPNIITNEFMMNFVWMGGGGATIGLAICLLLFTKSKQSKAIGSLTILPGIFNINEPLLFGLPIVLNIKMLIPFIFAPIVTALITYVGMSTGLVARPAGIVVPWTMPPIISGYLATGGQISGAVIQIISLAANILVYYPFVRISDKEKLKSEKEADEARLAEEANQTENDSSQDVAQPNV